MDRALSLRWSPSHPYWRSPRWPPVQDPSKAWLWLFFDRMASARHSVRLFWLMLGPTSYSHSFRQNQYVAIKVAVARSSETSKELGIFEHLASRRGQRGAWHVIELLGSFEHQGPNGRHLCLVFPVMGPNASTMVEQKFWPDRRLLARYPLPIAKSMLKQLLGGLNFLHQNGITHNGACLLLCSHSQNHPCPALSGNRDVRHPTW